MESRDLHGDIVHRIALLAEQGLLERVRECRDCKSWFYANRVDKVFCDPACSKAHWQRSVEGKESRRVKMREYMRERRKVEKQEKERFWKGVRRVRL